MLENVETDKSRPLSDFLCVNHKNEIEALVMARFDLTDPSLLLIGHVVCVCVCVCAHVLCACFACNISVCGKKKNLVRSWS